MATPFTINYLNTAFEIANLTKIHGEPTFEAICTLKREIINNSQFIHLDLGGGSHGHLRLVLFPREYALHSDAAYCKPNHPGTLIIPASTTLHMANTFKEQHKERLRVFSKLKRWSKLYGSKLSQGWNISILKPSAAQPPGELVCRLTN